MNSQAILSLNRLLFFLSLIVPRGGRVVAWTVPIPSARRLSPMTQKTTTTTINNRFTRRFSVVCQLSNLFGDGGSSSKGMPSLPKDVKEAVTKCRAATQEALKNRISRMDIEFPVGTKFNVESVPKQKRQSGGSGDGKKHTPTLEDLLRSDRELARLFVDMFQPVGGDQITVVFNDMAAADLAKKNWKGDSTANCRIASLDRRKTSTKRKEPAKKKKGFAAKLADQLGDDDNDGVAASSGPFKLPENTQVAMFVNPGPKELVIVEKICKEVGMGTLVILLNARTSVYKQLGSEAARQLFFKEFEPVFHLAAAPQDAAPNCLLYRAYPKNWLLARKPAVGQPKPILVLEHRPTVDECQNAFEKLELSTMEKGAEAAFESVASWFS